MKKDTRSKGVTLRDVVNHISSFKQDVSMRFDRMEKRMDRVEVGVQILDQKVNILDRKIHSLDIKLSNIDERLDVIEISIVEQRHEPRIRRIEKHLGMTAA